MTHTSAHKFSAFHGSSVSHNELSEMCEFGVGEGYFTSKAEFDDEYPDGDMYETEITISFKTRKVKR